MKRLDVTTFVTTPTSPIREVHIRQADSDTEYLSLDLAGARLVSNDKTFRYRIYRFDNAARAGATTALTFKSRSWRRGFPRRQPADRRDRERHVREQ